MTEVVIHCGVYKTGTTAVQNTFYENRYQLLSEGILYPATGLNLDEPKVGVRHDKLCYLYADQRSPPEVPSWKDLVDQLIAEIRKATPRVVFISCESWSRLKTREQRSLVLLSSALEMYFPTSRLVMTRDPIEYESSLYLELYVNRGYRGTMEGFHSEFEKYYEPKRVVSTLSEYGSLKTLQYDKSKDTVSEILRQLGASSELIETLPRSKRNNVK